MDFYIQFLILTMASVWRPKSWSSGVLLYLYTLYTTISMIVYYTFLLTEILDIFLLAETVAQITENMIQLVNVINVSQKTYTFLSKRKKIMRFMDLFYDDLSLPETHEEENIQKKFDDESRNNSRKLFYLYAASMCSFIYMPFFISDRADRVLPYRVWLPFSLDNVNNYYVAYLHQSWAVTIAGTVNGATETLASGFMIQICAQFAILESRFLRLPSLVKEMRDNGAPEDLVLAKERQMLVRLIHHHWRIFEMCDLLNEIFVFVIFFQFIASITVLCVSTYNLSQIPSVNFDFITILMFLSCMLLQIFLYTWYGNEITLRSGDLAHNILLSNWRYLSSKSIKNLMIISQRATKPIILSSGYVITLSNVAFTSIVKTSYSVYNVLSVN